MKILQIMVKNLAQGSKEESAKQSFPTKIRDIRRKASLRSANFSEYLFFSPLKI